MSANDLRISERRLRAFLAHQRLPSAFRNTARRFFLPLAAGLPSLRSGSAPLLLGINGAQGTGKSTLADFLELAVAELFDWRTAVLSIDDFYLTRAERQRLASDIHPLFETRGVPGTHDTEMLATSIDRLQRLPAGAAFELPRFDKSIDERAPEATWPSVAGPLDLVILEGWCVGSTAQTARALREPVNELEREEDPDAVWRTYANEQLSSHYEPVFSALDALAFLAAPSFEAVFRWRFEQEQKLADSSDARASSVMNREQVARFIRYYERLTRHNLNTLPSRADVVLTLDEAHAVVASDWNRD